MNKIIIISLFLISSFNVFSQKTAANEEKIKLYNTAIELYDKQLYNAAISNFSDYLPYATDPVNLSDVEYYIASCKLKLQHQNALSNMLDFISRYPQSRKVNNANFEIGEYYFSLAKFKTALTYYKNVSELGLSKDEKEKLAYHKGFSYFKSLKYKEAKETLQPLTTYKNQYQDQAIYYYGYVCYMDKDYKQALISFRKIEDKGFESVKLYIAEIFYLQNEYQKSIDYIKGKDFDGLNNNRDMLLGKCYYRLNNFEEAQNYFEKCNYNINNLTASESYEIGYTYYINKNCTKASELFEKVANKGDALGQSASYNLGDCYLKVGKKQNAFNAFYEAQRQEFDKSIQEFSMMHYAKLSEELNYSNKAIAAYQKFIELFPKSASINEAKKNLATLLYTSNDYKTAVTVMDEMTITDEATKELYQKILFLRAQELFLQKDFANAKLLFKKSNSNRVSNSIFGQSNYWIGEIEFREGKYDDARNYYQKFIDNAESKSVKYYPEALYAMGYTYFNQNKYNEAATYFKKYKTQIGYTLPQNIFYDATLRLGDCNFVLNNYNEALDAYAYIISNRATGSDYAMFQQGMIYGIQGKENNKIVIMKKISKDFPNSPYIPDAIFETAKEYSELDNDIEAERQYKYLIDDYPNSKYIKECHLALGQIYVRTNKTQMAIDEFKFVAQNYPGTPEAHSAIKNVETLSKKQGNIKEYLDWVKTLPNTNISTSKEDSLYYDAAYRKYVKNDCVAATKDFEEYLNNFSDGFFKLNAHFYAAECYRNLEQINKEISHLQYIAEAQNSEFKEDALIRLCNIYTFQKNCNDGLKYYELLEKYSNTNIAMKQSLLGQVKCNQLIGNREKTKTKAEQLLKYDQLSNEAKGESNNALGKYHLHDSLYKVAKVYFNKTLKQQQDVYGAEAKYYITYMHYMQDSLDKCKKSIVEFNNQYSNYDFWLDKTFVLLADYYIKKGDMFQAKATLNSIIESSTFEAIVNEAKAKLTAIESKGNKNNLIDEEQE